jgi:hypothetical protein
MSPLYNNQASTNFGKVVKNKKKIKFFWWCKQDSVNILENAFEEEEETGNRSPAESVCD